LWRGRPPPKRKKGISCRAGAGKVGAPAPNDRGRRKLRMIVLKQKFRKLRKILDGCLERVIERKKKKTLDDCDKSDLLLND
jgi:hypothetical protein